MPASLRQTFAHLDLEAAQEQVRIAMRKAIDHLGGATAFTRELNERLTKAGHEPITRTAVRWWMNEGTFVDYAYLFHIEAMTDMLVTRRHLRPDVYGLMKP
jgi:hypothetical protein